MSPRVELGLDSDPLDAIEADVAVAGFFLEDRPLRGGAGRVDWRLCGLVSRMLARDEIAAERGSALLLAGTGAFRAPRILLLGLGSRADFALTVAQDQMREAMGRCIDLGVRRIALAPLGVPSDDLARHAPALVGGVAEALRARESIPGSPDDFEIRVAVAEAGIETASQALDRAASAFVDQGIVVLPVLRRQHRPSPLRGAPPSGFPQPRL
ncbi:MAG: hypothetical protein NZ990_18185 [Myxococcota bacterium]|nr:hypothetical protein [Myxococcota bacterium]